MMMMMMILRQHIDYKVFDLILHAIIYISVGYNRKPS